MSTLGDDWKHRYYRKLKQTIRFCLRLQAAEERIAALEAELEAAQDTYVELGLVKKERDSFRELAERYRSALEELRTDTGDCVCDEPEKGHESTLCELHFKIEVALASHPPEAKGTSDADK